MIIDKKELQRLEDLSMLSFTQQERENFAKDLMQMTGFIDKIQEIEIEETNLKQRSVKISQLREDVAEPSMLAEKILENAPEKQATAFSVPRVVE